MATLCIFVMGANPLMCYGVELLPFFPFVFYLPKLLFMGHSDIVVIKAFTLNILALKARLYFWNFHSLH